jgi:hypothetical protein
MNHSVALNAALSFERMCHDIHSEMALASRPMPGMPLMQVRLINHLETGGSECLGQLL